MLLNKICGCRTTSSSYNELIVSQYNTLELRFFFVHGVSRQRTYNDIIECIDFNGLVRVPKYQNYEKNYRNTEIINTEIKYVEIVSRLLGIGVALADRWLGKLDRFVFVRQTVAVCRTPTINGYHAIFVAIWRSYGDIRRVASRVHIFKGHNWYFRKRTYVFYKNNNIF